MNVTVILIGPFRIGRFDEKLCEYPSGTSVREVIDELGLSTPLLGTVLINETHAGLEELLHDGDTLHVLPVMDGG